MIFYICLFIVAFIIIRFYFTENSTNIINDKIKVIDVESIIFENNISENKLYNYYDNLDRESCNDYAIYVFSPYDDDYLKMFVNQLISNETDDVSIINAIASFIQKIPYDLEFDYEYPNYPIETLVENQGDCEDKAILCASFLDLLGYNVSLLSLPNHMAVGVNLNMSIFDYDYYIDNYYYLEVTKSNSSLGYVPEKYSDIKNITVYPVCNRSVVFHSWNNASYIKYDNSTSYLKMNISLKNFGRKFENDIFLKVIFFGNKSVEINTTIDFLDSFEEKIIEVILSIPFDSSGVINTQIYVNDILIDEKTQGIP